MSGHLSLFWPLFRSIDHSIFYAAALQFYGLYPLAMSWVWICLSLFFRRGQESKLTESVDVFPLVSILVP
jgi:hypothetical protein